MATDLSLPISPDQLQKQLSNSAFAFRGYNITNLGRTPELLQRPRYAATMERHLVRGSEICRRRTGHFVDLVQRVRQREETALETYHEAIAMILAVEQAQIAILKQQFQIDIKNARMAYGFSLGEVSALVAAGVFTMDEALRIPLAMAADGIELAKEAVLGVLFSRKSAISRDAVKRLCLDINQQGDGVIGISAYLSPNSMLVIGQHDTLDQFSQRLPEVSDERLYLRRNPSFWPPLHTPIVWQRSIPNRAMDMMHTLSGGFAKPVPPVLSLVSGEFSYDDLSCRDILGRWIDHPQRLWAAVDRTLSLGVEVIVHVGPQPNIIPATFHRLSANIEAQTKGSVRMRALAGIVNRPWLQAILPGRANLLRAPFVRHITLEDWLLQQPD